MARVAALLAAAGAAAALGGGPEGAGAESGAPSPGSPACDLRAYDHAGRFVDPRSSHASLSRTVPAGPPEPGASADQDALTWVVSCRVGKAPTGLSLESFRPDGALLDGLRGVVLAPAPCPADVASGRECAVTPPVRATVDFVDRAYPSVAARSLTAEVGGRLVAGLGDGTRESVLVGGPRDARGADRQRGRLRFHILRASPGGDAAIGGDESGAVRTARAEARTASMLWGQCGFHFGPEAELVVEVVDPPPRHLIAIGCDAGLPASGGTVAFQVLGKRVKVETRAGDTPIAVAHAVARELSRGGLRAIVSPNARILPGALRTADVLVRDSRGGLVDVDAASEEALSTDPTLGVCLGEVALGDGLTHFDDLDAVAGTLEERTLVKAYADLDPTTIDVFVVPSFARTGRIGESFIDMDGSGIQNVVIIDRAGIRAGSRSYALSHELGHVLLDLPGHPDDFGVDRPWELMDADAADATVFGPRRLSLEDCQRAVLQSGPGSATPLLEPWPLRPERAKSVPRDGGHPRRRGSPDEP